MVEWVLEKSRDSHSKGEQKQHTKTRDVMACFPTSSGLLPADYWPNPSKDQRTKKPGKWGLDHKWKARQERADYDFLKPV